MKDPLDAFEKALIENAQAVSPSEGLRERIAAELDAESDAEIVSFEPASRDTSWRAMAAALAVLISLAAGVWVLTHAPGHEAALAAAEAADAEPELKERKSYLISSHDHGVVQMPGGWVARRMSYDLMEEETWTAEQGEERYVVRRPRSEVVYVTLTSN